MGGSMIRVMEKLVIRPPVVQIAIDVRTIDKALRIAEAAVRAGVDWLEAGTPLITFAGTSSIGALAQAFPGVPVLADYKAMDGVRKYAVETAEQGGRIATVCGVASDASVREMIRGGAECGVAVIVDLYAAHDVPKRATEVQAMGADAVYVHWGSDERKENPGRDSMLGLDKALAVAKVPVGISTFSVEDAVRGLRMGAGIAVIGVPLIESADVEGELRRYIEAAKSAYRPPH
jgi:3-hexulose-6-phosphate synthase